MRLVEKVLFFVGLYNFIFPLRLNIVPGFEYVLYLIYLVGIFRSKEILEFVFYNSEVRKLLLFVVAMVGLAILSSFINGGDYMGIRTYSKVLIGVLVSIVILMWSIKLFGSNYLFNVLKYIFISAIIIAATNVYEFFTPSFKQWLVAIIDTTGNTEYDESFRTHGFASSGGASLSVGLLIASFVGFFLMVTSKFKLQQLFFLAGSIFIYLSLLVVGRTGLFIGAPFVLILFLVYKSNFSGVVLKASLIVSLSFAFGSIIQLIDSKQFEILYRYGLEPVYNYFNYGSFESRSSNAVANMYYMPDWEHFMVGAGYWRYPTYDYFLSDVGYMKILMSTGIFGFILFYGYQIKIYYQAFKHYASRYNFKLGFYLMFGVLFLVETKEEFFTQNYGFKILIILIVNSWIQKWREKRILSPT